MKSSARNAVQPEAPPALHEPLTAAETASLFSSFFGSEDRILVAVSGGPDSMALLALLAEWKGASLFAATVDHGLRLEANAEAESVKRYCASLGIPHVTLRWSGVKPKSGLQEAARKSRYALLCDHMRSEGLTCLVTAHHGDDQAETVLLRLVAGSGIAGLAGMRSETWRHDSMKPDKDAVRDGSAIRHVRPLLSFTKQRLVSTCVEQGIPFTTDPSNEDVRFGRARLRQITHHLTAEGLTTDRLVRLAQRARQADEALDWLVQESLGRNPAIHHQGGLAIEWSAYMHLPFEIRLRILVQLLQKLALKDVPLKLERVETLVAELDRSCAARQRLRRSIGHWIVTLRTNGQCIVLPAPERQRGNMSSAVRHKT